MKTRQKSHKTVRLNAKTEVNKVRKVRNGTPFVWLENGKIDRIANLRNICANAINTKKQIHFNESDESATEQPKMVNFSSIKRKTCDITENLPKNYSTFVKPITNNEVANSTFQDLSIDEENVLFGISALPFEAQQEESSNQNNQGNQVSFELHAPEAVRDDDHQNTSLSDSHISLITEHPFEPILPAMLTNSSYGLHETNFCISSSRDIGIQTEVFRNRNTPKKTRNIPKALNPKGILKNKKLRRNIRPTLQGKKTHIKIYAQEVYIENYINKG